eukprot:m.230544 g.230544  ORF g.230544 m.230544 type:complete len:186 (+) comp12078_c0_seq1:60-617(+)
MSDWSEAVDESGKVYYVNSVTNETTWTRPDGYAAPTPAPKPAAIPSPRPRPGSISVKSGGHAVNVIKQGYLHKKGHVVKNWKTRYFVLTREALTYWETGAMTKQKGMIQLTSNTVIEKAPADGHRYLYRFNLTADVLQAGGVKGGTTTFERVYHLASDDDEDRQEWMRIIAQTIEERKAFLNGMQ